jgi:hypothetical protein
MIASDKLPNALYALQGVLIYARSLANHPSNAKEAAALLDYAEHLPRLIASEVDETNKFRDVIAEIASRYKCAFVLQRFDEAVPSAW